MHRERVIRRDACMHASWSNGGTAHPLVQSLSWGSEIAACEYLYMPVFLSKGKEARQNWFLCVNPRRVETQQKKSRKEQERVEKEGSSRRMNRRFGETSGEWSSEQHPLSVSKVFTIRVAIACFFLRRMHAEYFHCMIWFSFPSPSKHASLTHQLTCLTVASCKHHLTPAVFSSVTASGYITLIIGRYLILIRKKVKVWNRTGENEDVQPWKHEPVPAGSASSQNIHQNHFHIDCWLLLHHFHLNPPHRVALLFWMSRCESPNITALTD